ncbi:MAG: Rrf2 family transcriptional regulator [Nitrospiraceae bacterium]|nr:Rrf2 family transcriptional regulator [Nitrospiraceae bacterium]
MLKLSTKGRYGVRLMLELAQNHGGAPVPLSDIAVRQEISEKYLEHLIAPLKKAKLIHSVRGMKGGYTLANPPGRITLRDIVTAVEGSISVVDCTGNPSKCRRSKNCLTRGVWAELSAKISGHLSSITLQKLIDKNTKTKEKHADVN